MEQDGEEEADASGEDAATVCSAISCVCKLLDVCVHQGCLHELLSALPPPSEETTKAAFQV